MPNYTITYQVNNQYDHIIKEAFLEFLIVPETTDKQRILNQNVESSDKGYYFSENAFGFKVIRNHIAEKVQTYSLTYACEVSVPEINPFDFKPLLCDEERELLLSNAYVIRHGMFLYQTNYTKLDHTVWNPGLVLEDQTVFEFMLECNKAINQLITFSLPDADIYKRLHELAENPFGVCQDFTHLLLHVLRENEIPARYVCGYLNQGGNYAGNAALHAWVEAHLPGVGWIGLDPTNNLLADHNYIKIAHGRDYVDCASIKGTIKAPGSNRTEYNVKVQQQ